MSFEIFLSCAPGLENALLQEVRSKGFKKAQATNGGVTAQGDWPDVWRANLWLRGASRVLARIAAFRVTHLNDLETATRDVAWGDILHAGQAFRVEVSCSKSRIYHSGAAAERITRAISEKLQGTPSADAGITIMARIERDYCTISVDTSGELLHRRGYKAAVNKAPMRETMAALFLQQCGFSGDEPVYDPMCGSGTFVIEAAEIAARLNPGRLREFAFEKLVSFDPEAWEKMRNVQRQPVGNIQLFGSDRDAGAVTMSMENAARAGVDALTDFSQLSISDIRPPTDRPGLVIANPPWGARIGERHKLMPLYQSLGHVLRKYFCGWRVAIITTDRQLAMATGLPFHAPGLPVQHGGLRVKLYQTDPLEYDQPAA